MRKVNLQKQREMFGMINRWHSSRISQRQWCEKQGINLSTFKYWFVKWKGTHDSGSHACFLEIEPDSPLSVEIDKIPLHFPNGVRVDFTGTVEAERILSLINGF